MLEKTLESPLDCKEIQPVNSKGNNPKYSLKGLTLKLKLQYFGHLMQRTDSLEKTFMLGKSGGGRRRGWQRMSGWMASPTQWTWVWASLGSCWWTRKPAVLQSMALQRVGHNWVTEQQQQAIPMTVFSAWPRHSAMQRWERWLGQRVTSQSPAYHTGRGDSSQEHTSSKGQCTDEGLGSGKTRSGGELVTRGNWEGH